ncbi:MAG: hypothetical protein M0R80_08545 [Proteobacteria bacterium]|jgi:hypothetical protein|nr:hypothetical protein [Pseudomonadota bacterium]
MKQVNVLMEESLLEHLEKLSQIISMLCGKKITVSDVVRKSVVEYSKFGKVVIKSKVTEGQKLEINLLPATEDGWNSLPNDELMRKICMEEW